MSAAAHRTYAPCCFACMFQAETTASEPVDFADVELAPLNKDNLRRLMHEDVLAYRPELRSPAAGSSLPEAISHAGGREAARDGKHSSRSAAPPQPPNGNMGVGGGVNGAGAHAEGSHVSSRAANGAIGGSVNHTHSHSHPHSHAQHRERSSRTDREGRSSMSGSSRSRASENGVSGSTSSRVDAGRTHAAARVRSGGAVARQPFPTEG